MEGEGEGMDEWNACVYVWIIHSDVGVLSVWL